MRTDPQLKMSGVTGEGRPHEMQRRQMPLPPLAPPYKRYKRGEPRKARLQAACGDCGCTPSQEGEDPFYCTTENPYARFASLHVRLRRNAD